MTRYSPPNSRRLRSMLTRGTRTIAPTENATAFLSRTEVINPFCVHGEGDGSGMLTPSVVTMLPAFWLVL